MAEKKKYNSILVSGRKDETLTYSRFIKDEESGESVKESLDKKVNATDKLETQQIKDGAITNEKLAADSVGNTNLQDGSVSNEKLKDESITNEKLAENSITKDKLKDNTIGVEKLDPELRQAINAATGLPEDLVQTIQNVDDTLKDHQSQLDDKQSQIDDKQQQITANDEDISLLQTRSTQMEKAIKEISVSGGASQASAVTYENTESGLDSITAQGAIDELANKKFNKENIAKEFGDSKDKVVSQFALPFREIESPEFIKVIVDANDHLLFTINLDGEVDWGKGIPAPIRTKLQEIINQCQQDKTDILEAINATKGELSASIAALQEGKVDKEEGKSLIENEVKECFRVIENEEFIKAIVDSEDKVFFGFRRDTGKPYYPLNEMYHVVQNKEFFAAWITTDKKVVLGIRRDGQIIGEIHAVNALKQVISQIQADLSSLQEKVGTIDTNLKELLDVFSLQENEEFLAVEKDAEGKVLSSTNPDGSHYIHKVKSETIPEEFEHIEDPEDRMEITTDAEGKVIGYRDKEGTRHENAIVTNSLKLKGNGMSDLIKDLNEAGMNTKSQNDLSEVKNISIPIPSCVAKVNFISDELPTAKDSNLDGYMEYWDMGGNYFKKAITGFSLQGSTSLLAPKKNYAIDLVDTTIKFGNLVSQDSFHFKANYYDIVRGKSNLAYDLWLDMLNYNRSLPETKPWLIINKDSYTAFNGVDDFSGDFGLEARCTPAGFPVEIYHNGDYLGLFTMNLKKHCDNYNMDKKNAKHVLLDPDDISGLFMGAKIPWNTIEIRNPKKLKYQVKQNGVLDYNADLAQAEIMGEDSEFYDASDSNCKRTADVKKELETFKVAMVDIITTPTKEKLEKVFDIDWMIDFFLWSNLILDGDGVYRNTQWLMYDGIKMFPTPYDCDQIFGCQWLGNYIIRKDERDPTKAILGYTTRNIPFKNIFDLYGERIKERYNELKSCGIYTSDYVVNKLAAYMNLIGKSAYKKEFDKWNQTPCYRKPNVNDGWEFSGDYYDGDHEPAEYSEETEYTEGVYVKYGNYYYKSLKTQKGVNPKGNLYDLVPTDGGYFDDISRIKKWLDMRIEFLDNFYNNLK